MVNIDDLPSEIVCIIIGCLSNQDLVPARVAHRCFSVQESEATKARRLHGLWLRTSPERACEVRRADVLAYLYARGRVPHTTNLCAAAIESRGVGVVRLVRQRCRYWHRDAPFWSDDKALEGALDKGHMDIVWCLIDEAASLGFKALIDQAVRLRCVEITDWLIATRHPQWDAPFCSPCRGRLRQPGRRDGVGVRARCPFARSRL
nr:Ankyrin repeat domain containing protein [Pandoravirus aubagnensis]